jgi:hypothetical protein
VTAAATTNTTEMAYSTLTTSGEVESRWSSSTPIHPAIQVTSASTSPIAATIQINRTRLVASTIAATTSAATAGTAHSSRRG